MTRKTIPILALILLAPILLGATAAIAEDEAEKITVIQTTDLNGITEKYLLNTTDNTLLALDPNKATFLADQIKDLDATDTLQPIVLLSIDQPSIDVTNDTEMSYAWVMNDVLGTIIIGVGDAPDNTSIANLTFVKITPGASQIYVIRTDSDLTIYADNAKFSFSIENMTAPKAVIMTDDEFTTSGLSYIELRAMRNPPSSYQLIRSGSGEYTFTISATGTVRVWFDETHSPGDVDLFVFKNTNTYFASATNLWSWGQLAVRSDARLFADAAPQSYALSTTGQLKFVVKNYRPTADWRIAVQVSSTTTQPPQTTSTQPPATTSTQPQPDNGLGIELGGLRTAVENHGNTLAVVAVILIVLSLALIAFRR